MIDYKRLTEKNNISEFNMYNQAKLKAKANSMAGAVNTNVAGLIEDGEGPLILVHTNSAGVVDHPLGAEPLPSRYAELRGNVSV